MTERSTLRRDGTPARMRQMIRSIDQVIHVSRFVASLLVVLPLAGCTALGAMRPAEPPGWRLITTSAEALYPYAAAADGSGVLLVSQELQHGTALAAMVGDTIAVARAPARTVTFPTENSLQVALIETPFGVVAKDEGSRRGREYGVVSPDGRRVAVATGGGIAVGDLQTGALRRITSAPQPPPANWPHRPVWMWAGDPNWSADGRWVYFRRSDRAHPGEVAWWRVSVGGGREEPVEGDLLVNQQSIVRVVARGQHPQRKAQADGLILRSISPDFRWAAANRSDKPDAPMIRIYNLEDPTRTITHTYHSGRFVGTGWKAWAPGGSKVIFHARPEHDLARLIGVIDLEAGGKVNLYAFPDPAAGVPRAWGWVGADRLLVEMQPWNQEYTDYGQGDHHWWLLDLKAVPPVKPQTPSRLLSARLSGGDVWTQSAHTGPVTGGETVLAHGAPLALRFDTPVSPQWLRQHVRIAGPHAELETDEAMLGLATVRIGEGRSGEPVRIRVPALGFDLLLHRAGPERQERPSSDKGSGRSQ